MTSMSDLDELDLDGQLLRLLVAIVETGSITGARAHGSASRSRRSAISLDKLRAIVGDPLFVKSGRGIAPRLARGVGEGAREHYAGTASGSPRPTNSIRPMARRLSPSRPTICSATRSSGAARAAARRRSRRRAPDDPLQCADGGDAAQRGLPAHREPPSASGSADIVQKKPFRRPLPGLLRPGPPARATQRAEYLAADHVTVVYEPRRELDLDAHLEAKGFRGASPSRFPASRACRPFCAALTFMATAPSLQRFGLFQGLAERPRRSPAPGCRCIMIWSRGDHDDPSHRSIRGELKAVAKAVAAKAPSSLRVMAPPAAAHASDTASSPSGV